VALGKFTGVLIAQSVMIVCCC